MEIHAKTYRPANFLGFISSTDMSCQDKIRGAFNKLPDIFCNEILNCRRLLKIHYVIAIHLMRWLTNFYNFNFQWTTTATIGIHPTKASWWISKMQSGREETLEERYAIKLCFKLGKNAMQWKLDLLLWPRDQDTEFPVEACWLTQTQEGQTEQIHPQTFDDPFF